LIPALQGAGHDVRATAREPGRVAASVPVVAADAVTGAGLDEALEGVDVLYYLIHSMESAAGTTLDDRERAAVDNVVAAARRRDVRRAVYLGGPAPSSGPASAHLRTRLAVEQALLDGFGEAVALRSSIVVGARSRSFRLLVRLVERLRAVPLPSWRDRRVAPIDERDVIAMLVACATSDVALARPSLDAAGPDVLSYAEVVARIADALLLRRPRVAIDGVGDATVSRLVATIAGEDHALVGALMESLSGDLLPRDDDAAALLGVRRHGFDSAVERALREWERSEPLAAR
jgi:nucleoside-diphosphate-sugar epimerase